MVAQTAFGVAAGIRFTPAEVVGPIAGFLVLGQTLGAWQVAGLALITLGNVVAVGWARSAASVTEPSAPRVAPARALG